MVGVLTVVSPKVLNDYDEASDSDNDFSADKVTERIAAGVVIAINIIQVGIVIIVSFKFVTKANEVTLSFLVQIYFSIIIIFATMNMSVLTYDGHGWHLPIKYTSEGHIHNRAVHHHSHHNHHNQTHINNGTVVPGSTVTDEVTSVWETYCELLYVSTCTMTTVGFGDAYPTSFVARNLTVIHMLCSVFYSTVIASVGLSKRKSGVVGDFLTGSFGEALGVLLSPKSSSQSSVDVDLENVGSTDSIGYQAPPAVDASVDGMMASPRPHGQRLFNTGSTNN